jgi:hypothetical protein
LRAHVRASCALRAASAHNNNSIDALINALQQQAVQN